MNNVVELEGRALRTTIKQINTMLDVETGKTIHRAVNECWDADNRFIAAARTYLPKLIDRILRAIEILEPATDSRYLTCSGSCTETAKEALAALEAAE